MKKDSVPRSYGPLDITFPDQNDWSISAVLESQTRSRGDKTYLSAPGRDRTLSFAETWDQSRRIGAGLTTRGIRKGDRVAIYSDNSLDFILAWFGINVVGAVEVPINTNYFGDFLRHCLSVSSPKAIVVGARYAERFLEVGESLGPMRPRIFLMDEPDEALLRRFADVGCTCERFGNLLDSPVVDEPVRCLPMEPAAIIFTSGTTGPSKGVIISHAQMYFFAEECANLMRLGDDDVYMTSLPLFHANAQFMTTYSCLIRGAKVALYESFTTSQFSERLVESGATVTNFLGVMMEWITSTPATPFDSRSRLRCICAAPTAWSAVDVFRARFGVSSFVEIFGSTEVSLPIMSPYGEARPQGASGLGVYDWFDIQIADPETDRPVPAGEVGELQIRPRQPWLVTSGYFDMPQATAESRRNFWFHTGDAMRQDAEGWFYFIDRLKDCIRRRGENISAAEVEAPIAAHPAVSACAAVAIAADESAGEEEVCIYVVLKPESSLTPQELTAWCTAKLPRFLVPRYIGFIPQLPLTPTGKVMKADLRKRGKSSLWDRNAGDAASDPTRKKKAS